MTYSFSNPNSPIIMNLFSNPKVRKDFMISITDILAKIYKVTDPGLKRDIFNELSKLSDHELIAKKDLVERYLEQSAQLNQSYMKRIDREENSYRENQDRKNTKLPSLQNLF